ncbi:MAG: hypothetical protein R3C05_05435 [Pirellulaceae bacterium]
MTCQCGESFPVSPAQAGQNVQCPHCGQTVALPTLGQLRKLPEADSTPSRNTGEAWSAGRGALFSAVSAALLAMVVAAAWTSYKWMSIERPPTVEKVVIDGKKEIGEHNAPQLLEFWVNWGQPGMGVRRTPAYEQIQRYREGWQTWSYAAYAGTLVLSIALFAVTRRNAGSAKGSS